MDASVINTVNIFILIASIGTYLHLAKEKNLEAFTTFLLQGCLVMFKIK